MKCAIAANNSLVGIDDADLGVAFNVTAQSAGFSTGQRCMASSRMIVTECICDKFVAAVIDKIKMLKIDTALTAGTDIGPVASVNRAQGTNAREL